MSAPSEVKKRAGVPSETVDPKAATKPTSLPQTVDEERLRLVRAVWEPHVSICYRTSDGGCATAESLDEMGANFRELEYVGWSLHFPKVSLWSQLHQQSPSFLPKMWRDRAAAAESSDRGVSEKNPECRHYPFEDGYEHGPSTPGSYHHYVGAGHGMLFRWTPIRLSGVLDVTEPLYRLRNPEFGPQLDSFLERVWSHCSHCKKPLEQQFESYDKFDSEEARFCNTHCRKSSNRGALQFWALTKSAGGPAWLDRLSFSIYGTWQDYALLLKTFGNVLTPDLYRQVLRCMADPDAHHLEYQQREVVGCLGRRITICSTERWQMFYRQIRQLSNQVWQAYLSNTNATGDDETRQRASLDILIEEMMPSSWPKSLRFTDFDRQFTEWEEKTAMKQVRLPPQNENGTFLTPVLNRIVAALQLEIKEADVHLQRRDYDALLDVVLYDDGEDGGEVVYSCHFMVFGEHVCLSWLFGRSASEKREVRWINLPANQPEIVIDHILQPLRWQPADFNHKMGFHQPRSVRSTIFRPQ